MVEDGSGEVWERSLVKQEMEAASKEIAELKSTLNRANRELDKERRQSTDLRRLIQDGHRREKNLRAVYLGMVGEDGPAAVLDSRTEPEGERVDPSLVDRIPDLPDADEVWPTEPAILPSLDVHPGWGNFGSEETEPAVLGVSLLGLDGEGRAEVIETFYQQQLRNPELRPLFITDSDDFRVLRKEHFIFEYLPPWPGPDSGPSREDWEAFLLERLTHIRRKWGIRRFVTFTGGGPV